MIQRKSESEVLQSQFVHSLTEGIKSSEDLMSHISPSNKQLERLCSSSCVLLSSSVCADDGKTTSSSSWSCSLFDQSLSSMDISS